MFTIKRKLPKSGVPAAKRKPDNWEYTLYVPETIRLLHEREKSMPELTAMRELANRELQEWRELGMVRHGAIDTEKYRSDFQPTIASPMLSVPVTNFADVRIDDHPDGYVYEEKFDGERMICFVRNSVDVDHATFYSRTLKPLKFPYRIPLKPGRYNCVLDGELVFLDPESQEIVPVCDTGDRRQLQKQYRVFDVQMMDGEYVQHKPLSERKRLLSEILESSPHVRLVEYHDVLSLAQLESVFDETVNAGGEGLILKRKNECYMGGERRWIKLKELHINGRKLEVDLHVNRMLYDKNGILSVLECGYYDELDAFRRVCTVYSGLDAKSRTRIRRLSRDGGRFKPRELVVTIIADRITRGGSLRHPVFHRVRNDLAGLPLTVDPRLVVAARTDK